MAVVSCEVLTTRGERCRVPASYQIEVPGVGLQRLCGTHARRYRVLVRWDEPPPELLHPPNAARPWTAQEERYVLASRALPRAELAAQLGRTVEAINVRQAKLRREGRG